MTGPCHCCRPDRATPQHPGRRPPADSTRLAFDVPFACLVSSPLAATTGPHARVRHTRPTLGVSEDLETAAPGCDVVRGEPTGGSTSPGLLSRRTRPPEHERSIDRHEQKRDRDLN